LKPLHFDAAGCLVAILLALAGVAAHRASSHPRIHERTISIIEAPVGATDGHVAIRVPDLSSLGGAVLVVRGRVTNTSGAPVRLQVRLNGFEHAETAAGPRDSSSFVFALKGGRARALTAGVAAHTIEVAGPGNWELSTLEASTVRTSLGPAGLAAIVPDEVQPLPPGSRTLVAVLIVLVGAAVVFGFSARRVRRGHMVLTATAFAVLAALALAPHVSDWRVLALTAVVWALVIGPFAPALARALGAAGRAASWLGRLDETTTERGAVLVALTALVVALPIFEVVRGSPEFFVARNTSIATALGASALILVVFPAGLIVIERVLRRLSPALATVYFVVIVALFATALVHPWLTRAQIAGPWVMVATAAAAGAVVAVAVWRVAGLRRGLAGLAFAALVVPMLFFGRADVRNSLVGWSQAMPAQPLARTPPIVFVVFDEFPLVSLLDDAGRIDAERFPNFAALAADGSWYRETTTVSSQTVWAVPAIVSGRYPEEIGAVPTLRYYPGNLFTMLSGRYEMTVFGRFLQLCPEGACERDLAGPVDGPVALAADLGIVWLHIVSPAPLVDRLPPVVGDWRGFAAAARFRDFDGRRVRNDRLGEFERFAAAMTADPGRLYFLHSLSPHMPFEYTPSGRRYDGPDYQSRVERGAGLFERVDAAFADAAHQRHLLQVGFVDTMIGRLVARLRALGIYDQTLIVVTADHGASHREGTARRAATSRNAADILRVPLLIKRPGQRDGGPVDGLVESIDILPTVADVVGTRLSFPVDGRSLLAPEGRRRARVFVDRSFIRVARREFPDLQALTKTSLERRIGRFGTGSLTSLYAAPGTRDLLGRQVVDFSQQTGSVKAHIENLSGFQAVDLEAHTLPLIVRGRFFSRARPTLAIAVNGRIVATTVPFEEREASWYSTMIPESALGAGANDVQVYIVEGRPGAQVLQTTTR
jgi:hypothetical protein